MSENHWIVRIARHLPSPDATNIIVSVLMVVAFFFVVWWL
jgi:hypothetical protein